MSEPALGYDPAELWNPATAVAKAAPPRPIRVCFMIDRLTTGGTETQLVALIRHLDRSRIRPYLCLLNGEDDGSRSLEPVDCPVLRLGVRSFFHPWTPIRALRLARFLRRQRIDVLQTYLLDSTYLGVLSGRLAGVRCVIRTRNNINHWMNPARRGLGRLLNRFVTLTVANSEAARRAVLVDERPSPASVVVLENGVDLDRFATIPTYHPGDRAGPPRVGIVANLRPVKGVDVFTRAAAIVAADHPEAEFYVAGEGMLRPELERIAAREGIEGRFHLLGSVADVPALLACLDVAVLSSRAEGMPNAVLEYMAAGRPIVATSVGGTTSLIQDEGQGLLVPPDDPGCLAQAIGRLIRDGALAARLAAAARRRAQEDYDRAVMVRRFENLYEGLMEG